MGTEKKERVSIDLIGSLTGLCFGNAFFKRTEEYLEEEKPKTASMLAVDIANFHLYNRIHGREAGDELLARVAECLKEFQKTNGGVAGYLGGDNFALLVVCEDAPLRQLYDNIIKETQRQKDVLDYLPAFGIFKITDRKIPAGSMYDYASVALSHVSGSICRMREYTEDMDERVEEEIQLLYEIQTGIERDEFIFYIQPQCDIMKGKIVGGESLVRWNHREKGLIGPGKFIPLLEKKGMLADLDRVIWRKVCQWLRACIDKGYNPVPISINVSKTDIFSMNVPEYLGALLDEFELTPDFLKVEITESAYAENGEKIIQTAKTLRAQGFIVMMDDFGTGYSSLNMLKSVPVDVLKMDMGFLEINEQEEEIGIGILDSVINMAKQMRMPIVVEGVEEQEQENHLLKMGCRYTQGYFYYKPMPVEFYEKLIADSRNTDHEGFWCRQTNAIRLTEFLDLNLFNDIMVNNILGPAAFYDMYENNIEITRVNEPYFRLSGMETQQSEDFHKRFWSHVRDDERPLLVSIFEQAYENPMNGATGFIHYLRIDEEILWVYIRVFFLREKDGHKLFYASLSDMTEQKRMDIDVLETKREVGDLTEGQLRHVKKYYDSMPCGFGIGRVLLDESGRAKDYEIIYVNKEVHRVSGKNTGRLRHLMSRIFAENERELLEKAYRAAYLGEKVEMHIYSQVSGRYLDISMYQYQYGYVGCLLKDQTFSHIYESTLSNVMMSFREVYFLHLQDNYCRMIYPDDNRMLNRGNFAEMVNRHFATGKICSYDEENIRNFFSIEFLKHALTKQDSVQYKYKRSVKPVGEEWCQTEISVTERLKNGEPKTATVTIRSIEALMREKENRKRQNMAQMLANMSEGFFIYRAVGDEQLLYANPTVLKIFGCETMSEFKQLVNNSFQGLVYPEDLKRVQWEIHEQVRHSDSNMDFIRYRILRKDGKMRWIDDCGHLEDTDSDKDGQLFYVFISDITDSMTEEQKEALIAQSKRFNTY